MSKKFTVFGLQPEDAESPSTNTQIRNVFLGTKNEINEQLRMLPPSMPRTALNIPQIYIKQLSLLTNPSKPDPGSDHEILILFEESQNPLAQLRISLKGNLIRGSKPIYVRNITEGYEFLYLPTKVFLVFRKIKSRPIDQNEGQLQYVDDIKVSIEKELNAATLEKERKEFLTKLKIQLTTVFDQRRPRSNLPSKSDLTQSQQYMGNSSQLSLPPRRQLAIKELVSEELSDNQSWDSIMKEIKAEARFKFASTRGSELASVKSELAKWVRNDEAWQISRSRKIEISRVTINLAKIVFAGQEVTKSFKPSQHNSNPWLIQVLGLDSQDQGNLYQDENGREDPLSQNPLFKLVADHKENFLLKDFKLDEFESKGLATIEEFKFYLGIKPGRDRFYPMIARHQFHAQAASHPVLELLINNMRIQERCVFQTGVPLKFNRNFELFFSMLTPKDQFGHQPHLQLDLRESFWRRMFSRQNNAETAVEVPLGILELALSPKSGGAASENLKQTLKSSDHVRNEFAHWFAHQLGLHSEEINLRLFRIFEKFIKPQLLLDGAGMQTGTAQKTEEEFAIGFLEVLQENAQSRPALDSHVVKLIYSQNFLQRRSGNFNTLSFGEGRVARKILENVENPFHEAFFHLISGQPDWTEGLDPTYQQIAADFENQFKLNELLKQLEAYFIKHPEYPDAARPPMHPMFNDTIELSPKEQVIELLKDYQKPRVKAYIKLMQAVWQLKQKGIWSNSGYDRQFSTLEQRFQHIHDFVNRTCLQANIEIGTLRGLRESMGGRETGHHFFSAGKRREFPRGIGEEETPFYTELHILRILISFLEAKDPKISADAFKQEIRRKLADLEALEHKILVLNRIFDKENFQQLQIIHDLIIVWFNQTHQDTIQQQTVESLEYWITQHQFIRFLDSGNEALVEYFKKNRTNKYFERKFQDKIAEVTDMPSFLDHIYRSKQQLLDELNDLAIIPTDFDKSQYNFYFSRVVNPDQERTIIRMLESVEAKPGDIQQMIVRAKKFAALLNLKNIFEAAALEKLLSWEYFNREQSAQRQETWLADQLRKLDKEIAKSQKTQINSTTSNFDYWNLGEWDKDNLTDNELIQQMHSHAFIELSMAEPLLIFLSESTDEFLQKIKDECDVSYLNMIHDLELAITKLGFLYDESVQSKKFNERKILEGIFRLTEKDYELIVRLNNNLSTLKGLKTKIQGDRKKLAQDVLNISCVVFKRIEHKETFEFSLHIPIRSTPQANRGAPASIVEIASQQSLIDLLRRKDYEQLHQDAYYSDEEMRGHFTYAGILCNELESRKNQTSNQMLADAAAQTQKSEAELLELMSSFKKVGQAILKFRDNLCSLHELGLLRKEFTDSVIDLLGGRAASQFLFKSLITNGNSDSLLFLKINQHETIGLLEESNENLAQMISQQRQTYESLIESRQTFGMSYFSGERAYELFMYFTSMKADRNMDAQYEPTRWVISEYLNQKDLFEMPPELRLELMNRVGTLDQNMELCKYFFENQYLTSNVETTLETRNDSSFSASSANVIDLKNPKIKLNTVDFILRVLSNSSKRQKPVINLSQMMFCNEQTSELDLSAFISRCRRDKHRRVFFILNTKDLTESRLGDLVQSVSKAYSSDSKAEQVLQRETSNSLELKRTTSHEKSSRTNTGKINHMAGGKLVILNNGQTGVLPNSDGFEDVTEKLDVWSGARIDAPTNSTDITYRLSYISNLEKLKVVTSDQAGSGKTYRIRHEVRELRKKGYISECIELSISGEITRQSLRVKMEKLFNQIKSLKPTEKFALHIKLDYIEEFEKHASMIDFLLYSITFAGKANNSSGIINMGDKIEKIFIEIGNSMKSRIESLELISMLKIWDSQNQDERSNSEHRFTTKLFTLVPDFTDASTVIGYSKPADPMFLACAKIIENIRRLKVPSQAWETVKIPSITPAGSYFEDADQAAEAEKTYRITPEQANQLLKMEFKRVENPQYLNFFCFMNWVKTVLVIVNDIQLCEELLQNDKMAALKNLTGQKKRSIDTELLRRQVLLEVLNTATQTLLVHNQESLYIQRDVIEIYEAKDDVEMERLLNTKKDSLKQRIEKQSWDPNSLFIPMCSPKHFVPVIGSETIFSQTLHSQDQDPSETSSRAMLQRYIIQIRAQFEKELHVEKIPDQTAQEHSWFAWCLSKMDLKPGVSRNYNDIMQITTDFPKLSPDSTCEKKGYALTSDNFMKICMILLKVKLKQPIVIMGESGCGKTYLSQFVVEGLLDDKLRIVTLYSGFSEANLIKMISEFVQEANQLQKEGKRLWVFFDEFNTTAIQSIIADMLIDRVFPSARNLNEKVPQNMMFIACCNPFRIKLEKTDGAMIGLIPHEKATRLSHIVKPIPDRLLNLVMDFGQLSKQDEKFYIESLVKAEKLFELADPIQEFDSKKVYRPEELINHRAKKQKYNQLSLLIHRIHGFVREKEERSGVSLRDIKRVCLMFKWFRKTIYSIKNFVNNLADTKEPSKFKHPSFWIIKSPSMIEIAASLCAVTVCYVLRMNGQLAFQKEMHNQMRSWAIYAAGLESISGTRIIDALRQVAQAFLYNVKALIPKEISQNQAFEENYITLLACYSIKVPLIIVGAPGTSKTLSTNIFLQALDNNKQKYSLLDGCEQAVSIYFGGSQTSTSEAVERLFDRAAKFHKSELEKANEFELLKQSRMNDPTWKGTHIQKAPVIFFDELGLAELSPHNPLKVMHSRLETNQGQIAFIGVSNWKPDQSKLNRMVCLMRPDLTRDDLLEIFRTSFKNVFKLQEVPEIDKLFEGLSDAYLQFREWQKMVGRVNKYCHPYFHGSRDIYGCYNSIFHQLNQEQLEVKKVLEKSRVAAEEKILGIIKRAIERNLNGELYYFNKNMRNTVAPGSSVDPRMLPKEKLSEAVRQIKNLIPSTTINSASSKQPGDASQQSKTFIDTFTGFPSNEIWDLKEIYSTNKIAQENTVCTSSEVFKYIYMTILQNKSKAKIQDLKLQEDWIRDTDINKLLSDSATDNNSRFIIVRSEGQIVDELLIQRLRSQKRELLEKIGRKDEADKIIDWRQVDDKSAVDDLLSSFKTYVSHGYTVVMKNLDSLYGGLYDLFNQKYTVVSSSGTEGGQVSKQCYLYYGETRHPVEVSPEFKCIILLDSSLETLSTSDVQKRFPAPFLNRFEKYFLKIDGLLGKDKTVNLKEVRRQISEMARKRFSFIAGLNLDYLISVVETSYRLKPEGLLDDDRRSDMLLKCMALSTSNISYGGVKGVAHEHDTRVLLESLNKASFESILKASIESQGSQPRKQIILTFSSKAKFETLRKQSRLKDSINTFEILSANSVFKNFLAEKDNALRGITKPLIIQFITSHDYGLISAIRRIIDERKDIKAVILLVHMSKADKEVVGTKHYQTNRRVYIPKKGSIVQRLDNGERSKLIDCGGINTWNGWTCQTNENLEYETPVKVIEAFMDMTTKQCLLPSIAVAVSGQLPEGFSDYRHRFATKVTKEAILRSLENLSTSLPAHGEIKLSKLRELFSSELADHPIFKEVWLLFNTRFGDVLASHQDGKKLYLLLGSNVEDLYEELPDLIQKAVLEDKQIMPEIEKMIKDLDAYCKNLYSVMVGFSKDLIANDSLKLTWAEFRRHSKYAYYLSEGLKPANEDQKERLSIAEKLLLPRTLRYPVYSIYENVVKLYTEFKSGGSKGENQLLHNDTVTTVSIQYLKTNSDLYQDNRAIEKEAMDSLRQYFEIEECVLDQLLLVAATVHPIASKPAQNKSSGAAQYQQRDMTQDIACDIIRILFGGSLNYFKTSNFIQSDLDMFYSISELFTTSSMIDELTKKYQSQDRLQNSEQLKFLVKFYPMFMLCQYYATQTDEIMKNLYLLEDPIKEFKDLIPPPKKQTGPREVPFFQLKLLDLLFERLRFETFKLENSFGNFSIDQIVAKLKKRTGMNQEYKKLVIHSYEVLNMLEKSDRKTAILNDLAMIEFSKVSGNSTKCKEVNQKIEKIIVECGRNTVKLAVLDFAHFLKELKTANPPTKFAEFLDSYGEILRSHILISKDFSLLTEEPFERALFNGELFNEPELVSISSKVSTALCDLLQDFVEILKLEKICFYDNTQVPRVAMDAFFKYLMKAEKYPTKVVMLSSIANDVYIQAVRLKDKRGEEFDEEFRNQIHNFETLMSIYKREVENWEAQQPESNCLAIVLSSCILRVFFNKTLLTMIEKGDYKFEKNIYESLKKLVSQELIDTINNKHEAYPLVFYLQKLFNLHSGFTRQQTANLKLVNWLLESFKDSRDLTRIILFDDSMIKYYQMEVASNFDTLLAKLGIPSSDLGSQLNQLDDLISRGYPGCAQEFSAAAQLYISGLYFINAYVVMPSAEKLTVEAMNEKRRNYSELFRKLRSRIQSGVGVSKPSTITVQKIQFCNFVINILSKWGLGKLNHYYGPDFDHDTDLRMSKLILQATLMTLCFPQQMRYNPTRMKDWLEKDHLDQTNFNCMLVNTDNFKNYCNQLEIIISNRLNDAAYRDYNTTTLKKNLGVYMCSCGFMYSVLNCGYAVGDSPCPRKGCGKRIGGSSHKSYAHITHIQTLQDLHGYIQREYESQKLKYSPHETSSESAMSMKIIEFGFQPILDSQKANNEIVNQQFEDYINNFYFKHLMDHMYLLGLPYILDETQETAFANLTKRVLKLQETEAWKVYRGGVVKTPEAYFLHHVEYDLEKVQMQIQLDNKKDILDWFKAVLSKGADMIMKGAPPDPKTQLYLDRGMFKRPADILNEQNAATDKMAGESFEVSTKTARQIIEQRLGEDLSKTSIRNPIKFKIFRGLFATREFAASDAQAKFQADLHEGGLLQINYPLIYLCVRKQPLFAKFAHILGTALELYQYVDAMYSGRISLEDASSKSIAQLGEKDPYLEDLHFKFKKAWEIDVLKDLLPAFPDEFEFSFTCHTGIDVKSYIHRVSDPNAPLINFIFMDSTSQYSDEKLFFPKSIIQSLVMKVQNPLVKLARDKLKMDVKVDNMTEMSQPGTANNQSKLQEDERLIKDISKENLLAFKLPDLRADSLKYARLDAVNQRLDFNYKRYELTLAEEIVTRNILINVEDSSFKNFEFGDETSLITTSVAIYLRLLKASDVKLPTEVREVLDAEKAKKQGTLDSLQNSLLEICREFRTHRFYNHSSSILSKLEELPKELDLLETVRSSEFETWVFETLQIKHIQALYEYLRDYKLGGDFIKQFCNKRLDSDSEQLFSEAFQILHEVAESDASCKDYLAELGDQLYDYISTYGINDPTKLRMPFYGCVGEDDKFEGFFEKSGKPTAKSIASDFVKSWNFITFEFSDQIFEMLRYEVKLLT